MMVTSGGMFGGQLGLVLSPPFLNGRSILGEGGNSVLGLFDFCVSGPLVQLVAFRVPVLVNLKHGKKMISILLRQKSTNYQTTHTHTQISPITLCCHGSGLDLRLHETSGFCKASLIVYPPERTMPKPTAPKSGTKA